jgi:hypothetical protein
MENLKYESRFFSFNKLKAEVQEFLVRLEINNSIFNYYFEARRKIAKAKNKEITNYRLYKPDRYIRLYYIMMPCYFLHANLFIFFLFRRTFNLSKYIGVMMFNLLSLNLFCLVLDKKIFFEQISRPLPYSKYMREE